MSGKICPNCGRLMRDITWVSENPLYTEPHYICDFCKIESHQVSVYPEKWTIPRRLQASDRQKRTVEFICSQLQISSPVILTKKLAWKFINENLEKAINLSRLRDNLYEDFNDEVYSFEYY